MAPIARTTLVARALRARAGTARQSFTRLPRRSYASGHGPVKPTLQSELPWIASSVAVTVGGVYLLWPEPAAHGHGHDDHAEHKEEKEDDGGEEKSADGEDDGESKDEEKDEKKDEKKDESKDESKDEGKDEKKDEDKDEGKDEPKEEDSKAGDDESKDDKSSDEDKSEEKPKKEAPTKENPDVNEDRDDNNREVRYKDAKGGIKKRLESKAAITQGDNVAGVHSGQGEHVYNTDTKHSTDQKNNPSMSKKGEGDPDTAKLKTTVDPKRAQK